METEKKILSFIYCLLCWMSP